MLRGEAAATARAFKIVSGLAGFNVPMHEVLASAYARIVEKDNVVIDCGANEGYHLARLVDLVGPSGVAIAFEPIPQFAMDLRAAFARPNVRIEECALSNFIGSAPFNYVVNAPGESGLKRRLFNVADPIIESIEVQVKQLDVFIDNFANIDFIKINLQGGEIDCLKGMLGILGKYKPYVSVEYGYPSYHPYGYSSTTLFDLAMNAGYLISDPFGNLIVDAGEWQAICDQSYWVYFLVPLVKVEDWRRRFGFSAV